MEYDKPHPDNFCGGNYQDWMEVNLIDKCNGKCSWCVEKRGYHPKDHVSWEVLAEKILGSNKKNIILLGGEPTLFPDIDKLLKKIGKEKNVYITTNGSLLSALYVHFILTDSIFNPQALVKGINISIHSSSLSINKKITGIQLYTDILANAIKLCKYLGISVRFNCNLIKGATDSKNRILEYIEWAKGMGADSVRFAELKFDEENFVDLYEIFGNEYGLNLNPFIYGCHKDTVINGMPVNFRQMCGRQTSKRPQVMTNPKEIYKKEVLYYDGIIYSGWQLNKENTEMNKSKKDKEELVSLAKEIGKKRDELDFLLKKFYKLVHKGTSTEDAKREKLITNDGSWEPNVDGNCVY